MYGRNKEKALFLIRIQEKREKMCLFGRVYGLNSHKTIQCSQELDSLLNEYYLLFQSINKKKSVAAPRMAVAHSYVRQYSLPYAK
ncbi:aspartyl-phosphate phosphatase Spo0E family protein [Bacillus sp. FJAT-49732]|uniref:Aspartyl-phosphate phosphatase Spo0E family protein n=1 Tax=Lederbergia citrisecunda TaxID=2833583 RepID=A0A942TIJ5_9BACI|nr:aspartyl-phosphate phosphatase Spo0E family protein [Lederbergia citrisecunda]MBS4198746.1 aspartyl-phosphate phosphatase Spo0E family protein [Lederbergia citrisecunda]